MNIKAYISSGILEHYVLGLASAKERKEVEMYSKIHPEIKKELNSIELAMEQYAQLQAIETPTGIDSKINAKIDELEKPALNLTQKPTNISSKGKLLILLSVVSLLLGLLAFSNYQKNQNQVQKISTLENNLKVQKENCDQINNENEILKTRLLIIQNTDNQFFRLKGTSNTPSAIASIIYNIKTQKSYLSITELATPPSDKQYQLWAIVNGTPVDMGVFELALNKDTIQEVPFIENPTAFAVTLEKRGGNPTPTLDQMVLIGNAS